MDSLWQPLGTLLCQAREDAGAGSWAPISLLGNRAESPREPHKWWAGGAGSLWHGTGTQRDEAAGTKGPCAVPPAAFPGSIALAHPAGLGGYRSCPIAPLKCPVPYRGLPHCMVQGEAGGLWQRCCRICPRWLNTHTAPWHRPQIGPPAPKLPPGAG